MEESCSGAHARVLQAAFPPDILAVLLKDFAATGGHADATRCCPAGALLAAAYPPAVAEALARRYALGPELAEHNQGAACCEAVRPPAAGGAVALERFYPALEDRFTIWYNTALVHADELASKAYMFLTMLTFLLAAWNMRGQGVQGMAAATAYGAAVSLVLALPPLLARRLFPAVYVRHREAILAAMRIANVAVHVVASRALFPAFHASVGAGYRAFIFSGIVPIAAPGMRHRVRLALHVPLQAALCAVCVAADRVLDAAVGPGGWPSAPLASHAAALCVLGFVLPTLTVRSMERRARRDFLTERARAASVVSAAAFPATPGKKAA